MVAMPLLPGAVPLPAPVHLYALVLRTLWEGSDIRPGSPDMGMTRAWGGVRLLQWCDVPSPAPIRRPFREPGAARDPPPDLDRARPPQPGERRLGAAGRERHAILAPASRSRVPGLRVHAVDAAGDRAAAGGEGPAVARPAAGAPGRRRMLAAPGARGRPPRQQADRGRARRVAGRAGADRKSTRLNSSHVAMSYAVFCLKKRRRHGCSAARWRR